MWSFGSVSARHKKGRTTNMSKTDGAKKKVAKAPKRTPRSRRPECMSLEEWQIALRREYGREQDFQCRNLGTEPLFLNSV